MGAQHQKLAVLGVVQDRARGGRALDRVRDDVELAVQINSKLRSRITVPSDASREETEKAALEAVAAQLAGAAPKKIIVVPGRLVNIIA